MSFRSDVEVVILDSTALVRLHQFDLEAALLMAGRGLRGHPLEYRVAVVAEARHQILEKYSKENPKGA